MMKTKRTLRQTILALTAIASFGFGMAACENSTGGGSNVVRVFEDAAADLDSVNAAMGLTLTYGQSGISTTLTRANAIAAGSGGWTNTGAFSTEEIRAGLPSGSPVYLTTAEINSIMDRLSSHDFVVFARATSSTVAYLLIIVR